LNKKIHKDYSNISNYGYITIKKKNLNTLPDKIANHHNKNYIILKKFKILKQLSSIPAKTFINRAHSLMI